MLGLVIVRYRRLPTSRRNQDGSDKGEPTSLLSLTLSSRGVPNDLASTRRAEEINSLAYFRRLM